MQTTKLLTVIVLAAMLGAPLAGCATRGKVKLSAARMCAAAGGTYVNKTCNPGATNQKTAKQMCEAHGGWYMADLDQCEVEGEP